MTKFQVTDIHHGQRLDVFLTEELGLTRSSIAKQLKLGAAKINGKTASVHQFLKQGDVVEYAPQEEEKDGKEQRREPVNLKDILVKDTPDWLVLNKPVGLLVHPDAQHKHGTLVDALIKYDPAMAAVGEDPQRPGIVHRLDREVSGLMVVARTQAAFDDLKKQFSQHTTAKTYAALVYNAPPKDEGDIKFRIARSASKARMAAKPEGSGDGRAAWTHYKVIKKFRRAALLELQILSGRTHQIRAHLHALGCPIIGDSLYSIKNIKPIASPRLLLQSTGLEFADPATGETVKFHLDADPAFAQTIESLKTH